MGSYSRAENFNLFCCHIFPGFFLVFEKVIVAQKRSERAHHHCKLGMEVIAFCGMIFWTLQDILDVYGWDIVRQFSSNFTAKVSYTIQTGNWQWPQCRWRTTQVESLFQAMPATMIPMLSQPDSYRWKCDAFGVFTTHSVIGWYICADFGF